MIKGYQNSRQLVILIAQFGLILLTSIFPLLANSQNIAYFLIPICFFSSFGIGTSVAVIQEITPPTMRAQMSAIFIFIVNLLGLGFGPSIVAWVTQYIFQEDKAVGYSLALVSFMALFISMICIWSSQKAYKESVKKAG